MTRNYRILDEHSLLAPAERPNLSMLDFGLAVGTIWALIAVLFTAMGINAGPGTPAIGSFLIFLSAIYPGYSPLFTAVDLLTGLIGGFVHGYLFGVLAAFLYNIWRGEQPFGVKLPRDFAGSPEPFVISAGEGKHPYTIAIIANPVLESEASGELRSDPILEHPRLFQAKVAAIIAGFAQDAVLNPRKTKNTFLDQMRLITLFNPKLAKAEMPASHQPPGKHALCREADYGIIVEPLQRLYRGETTEVREERLLNFIADNLPKYYDSDKQSSLIDVVYVVTGSKTHTRSSARYTIDDDARPGAEFELDFGDETLKRRHAFYTRVPGMVAYSAWDNRLKTPIHEFAHAMSSTTNGAILDEYYDDALMQLRKAPAINKHYRENSAEQPQPLPQQFAVYAAAGKTAPFRTDRGRHEPVEWKTYVPARENITVPCTMDFSEEEFAFDLLISQYMRDRLAAKASRG